MREQEDLAYVDERYPPSHGRPSWVFRDLTEVVVVKPWMSPNCPDPEAVREWYELKARA